MPISDLLPWNREKAKYDLKRWENNDIATLRDEMNAVFNEFFTHPFSLAPISKMLETPSDFFPGMDISETEKEIILTADLPGMDEKDIQLSIEGRVFTMSGTRQQETERKDAAMRRVERSYGSFQRRFTLPCEVDINQVDAAFSRGVLRVVIPKPARARGEVKRIPIKTR